MPKGEEMKVPEVEVSKQDEDALNEAAGDYEISEEDKKSLGEIEGKQEEVAEKEAEEKMEDLKAVSAFIGIGTIFDGETRRHKLPNNEVVMPIKYQYKPMTDIQRARYSEKIRKTQSIERIRHLTYAALAQHVVSIEIDGFDPTKVISWSGIRPTEVIEEIMDAVTGQITLEETDLKNW